MKLGTLKDALAASLHEADQVCGVININWVGDAVAALAPLGEKARCFDSCSDLVADVVRCAQAGDHIW